LKRDSHNHAPSRDGTHDNLVAIYIERTADVCVNSCAEGLHPRQDVGHVHVEHQLHKFFEEASVSMTQFFGGT
jgi:hypothetical protein